MPRVLILPTCKTYSKKAYIYLINFKKYIMKKVLFFAVYLLFSMTVINAQDVKFGAKAGVNFASITGDDTDDLDGRTAIHLGVVAEIPISEKFSFQPELLYSAQGASQKSSFDEFDYEAEINLDYLNLPLMAKYYVAEGFSLEAGPQVGFLMSAKAKVSGGGESEEEDIKDSVKGINFGVNFGVGYKLDSGLNFGARYNLGLSNDNDDSEFPDDTYKNSVIQLSVGYFF